MIMRRTIFQYQTMMTVIFFAHIQVSFPMKRFNRVACERTGGVFLQYSSCASL